MTIQHAVVDDPLIHEPKGASTATVDTVYVSDGAGSGAWQTLDEGSLDTASIYADIEADITSGDIAVTGSYYLHITIPDVSTAKSVYVPVINDSTFVGARLVLEGTLTTADASVTFTNAAAASMGTAVTVGFSGSGAGDAYTFTPSANATLTGPTHMIVSTDGGSTGTQSLDITLEFTSVLNS